MVEPTLKEKRVLLVWDDKIRKWSCWDEYEDSSVPIDEILESLKFELVNKLFMISKAYTWELEGSLEGGVDLDEAE